MTPGMELSPSSIIFQVNTVVGLFWIMLKISSWLVVFFVPPKKKLLPFVPLFTICIISPKTVPGIRYILYISYSYFITLNSTLFSVHLDLRELLP